MTTDEYRSALSELSDDKYDEFKRRWGGAAERTREKAVAEFAYSSTPEQWDRIVVMHLRDLGIAWVRTEGEKAAATAERSAKAAEDSAREAKRSADQSRDSARAAWWAVVVSLLAIIATIALARKC